jgi:hypothetical protein
MDAGVFYHVSHQTHTENGSVFQVTSIFGYPDAGRFIRE